jgi:2,4-dienoyl-CoA reductase-like NADH-dependent reductase (Old Yellow Enzyme family)/NADPH-dependent 2,4-dienoyl-CoA reductase/sulfur reductase-like enzyme
MSNYEKLFSPITIQRMTLKNRIVMPPMGTNFAGPNGEITDEHISYYEQRAKGGTGLIILENACLAFPLGSNGTTQLRIDEDRFIPGLYRLTERLHKHGACVAVQINHAGASAVPDRIGGQPVSSSNIPSKTGGAIPRSLEKDEILEIVNQYGKAAKRVVAAGFDAVEIHAGHSYLLCQFLSPVYNKRTDEFGGSYENRARIVRMVLDRIREEVGPFFPISLRFSAEEFVKGGNTLEDTLNILEYLSEGVDIFNVSAALNDTLQFQIDQMNLPDGWRSYMAKAVRDKFHKPTIATGNVRNPQIAESILQNEEADLIGMGRGLIAEPNWVKKVQAGEEEFLRKCISCNIGCAGHRIALNRPIRCTINPDLFHGDEYKEREITRPVNVVVIGGGTAGLEAACTAAEVGCTTILFEQKPYLGGLAREISRLPEKKRIEDFPNYLVKRSERLPNLIPFTNTKADIQLIASYKPDVIVNATGSTPLLPPIKGLHDHIDKPNGKLFSIFGLLKQVDSFKEFIGKKVAVIGGGAVGLDVVEFFAERGAEVTMVERMPLVGKDLDHITRISMMTMLKERHVDVRVETSLMEVAEDHFKVSYEGVESNIEFDYGFVCLGMKAENPILADLQSYFSHIEVLNIGDSWGVRKIMDGVREGRNILTTLENMGALPTEEIEGKIPAFV